MSWTRITNDLLPTGLVCGWVGGYDGDEWKQTPAYRTDSGLKWHMLGIASAILHPITYFAPFLIPEPPPKPVSLLDDVKEALEHLESWWGTHDRAISEVLYVKNLLRKAIAREDANVDE